VLLQIFCFVTSLSLVGEYQYIEDYGIRGPPLWSSGQSCWLQIHRSWVRFPALPDFLRSSGFGTVSIQSREYN
jgi:hypothetical protein